MRQGSLRQSGRVRPNDPGNRGCAILHGILLSPRLPSARGFRLLGTSRFAAPSDQA